MKPSQTDGKGAQLAEHESTQAKQDLSFFTSQSSSFGRILHRKHSTAVLFEKSSCGFSFKNHFRNGGGLCVEFDEGQRRLLEWSSLCLLRECYGNLLDACRFEQMLEKLARDELGTLQEVCGERCEDLSDENRSARGKRETLGLERLSQLCQDTKIHLDRWKVINQHILSQRCLRLQLPVISDELLEVRRRFDLLKARIMFWLQKLVHYGLQVFACSTVESIGMDVLERLWQGLEDYNRLSSMINKMPSKQISYSSMFVNKPMNRLFSTRRHFNRACVNFDSTSSESNVKLPTLPLNKILNMIISERAKRLLLTFSTAFLSERRDLSLELNKFVVSPYEWEKLTLSVIRPSKKETSYNGVIKRQEDENTLATTNPIIQDFLSQEEEVMEKLLLSCSVSTTLIQKSGLERKMKVQISDSKSRTAEPELNFAVGTDFKPSSGSKDSDHGSILKTDSSPKYFKRVQWKDSVNPEVKSKLVACYVEALWNGLDSRFFKQGFKLPHQGFLSSKKVCGIHLMTDSVLILLKEALHEALTSGTSLPSSSHSYVESICQHLTTFAVQASVDAGFGQLLGVALNDKCPQVTALSQEPGTATAKLFIKNFAPLQCLFSMASQWTADASVSTNTRVLPKLIVPIFQHMLALATFCFYWLKTKILHFLSSWSLGPFFLLIHHDLKLLKTTVFETVELAKLCTTIDGLSEQEQKTRHAIWQETDRVAMQIQCLLLTAQRQFVDKLNKTATDFWQELFPSGKIWRRSRATGSPCEYQPYVDTAIHHILQPAIMAVRGLSESVEKKILSVVVESMMESWSKHILAEEVRFSVYGAQQLQLDITHVKFWISSKASGLSTEVQSVLASLEVFDHLDGAVQLLLFQPQKKKMQFTEDTDLEFESQISTMSGSSTLSGISDGFDLELLGDRVIPNKEQWLDLRLRGGKARKGLVRPFCLKSADIK